MKSTPHFPSAIVLSLCLACTGGSGGKSSTTTASGPGPGISAVTPAPGAIGIPVSSVVQATFATAIEPETVTPASFLLLRGSNQVAGSVSAQGSTATFTSASPLASGVPYTAILSSGIQTLDGVPLPGDFQWNFTTEVILTPFTLLDVSPLDGAIEVSPNTKINMNFSELVSQASFNDSTFVLQGPSGSVAGSYVVIDSTAIFTPGAMLDGLTTYQASVNTGIQSVSGKNPDAPLSWSFTTRDLVPCDLLGGNDGDCNGNGIPDEDDIVSGLLPDCNANCVPDSCEGEVSFKSGSLAPIGDLNPQSFAISNPPLSEGDVTVIVGASADLSAADETIEVRMNGATIGTAFQTVSKTDCFAYALPDQLIIPKADFNAAAASGGIEIQLVPSAGVDGFFCTGGSFATVLVRYLPEEQSPDCDGNGIPDACESDCNANGVNDVCELTPIFLDKFTPIGATAPHMYYIMTPPFIPFGGMILGNYTATGDFNLTSEYVDVFVTVGTGSSFPAGKIFENTAGTDCQDPPVSQSFDILWFFFGSGPLSLSFAPTASVDAAQCNPTSFMTMRLQFPKVNDCNGNGILDSCDIASGFSQDANGNGIPDSCPGG